jgi:hypothetical protein
MSCEVSEKRPLNETLRKCCQKRLKASPDVSDCRLNKYRLINSVVLEKSNVAKLASTQYLSVHSLPQEDRYDTDDASAREI